jgi:hypothetical protein
MMQTEHFLQLFVRRKELSQDVPVVFADDDVGPRFYILLEDEELEVVFLEFKVPRELSE